MKVYALLVFGLLSLLLSGSIPRWKTIPSLSRRFLNRKLLLSLLTSTSDWTIMKGNWLKILEFIVLAMIR
jgi:hypothetical protein